jgi:hypothetical protein
MWVILRRGIGRRILEQVDDSTRWTVGEEGMKECDQTRSRAFDAFIILLGSEEFTFNTRACC